MKNSKYLLLAAIAAATASLSSCSDNDVLEGAKDTGIPFTVTATTNSGGSRGSDISSLSNFQLWGFGTEQDTHFDGDNFTLKSGSTTTFQSTDGTPNWPNTNACVFYAISDNTSTMDYDVAAGSPGVNSTKAEIRNGSFDYTIPTTIANQKDLLVAAATGKSSTGVQLKFDHALTAAKLNLRIRPKKTEYGSYYDENDEFSSNAILAIKIRKITIHNIIISGTYNFDGTNTDDGAEKNANNNYVNGSWTPGSVLGDYVIDLTDNPLIMQCKTSEGDLEKEVDVNGYIYFIPQTITSWNIVPNNSEDLSVPGTANNYSYIEFEAISMEYDYLDINDNMPLILALEGWSKDADGAYLYNNKIVVDKDGKVVDFDNEELNNLTPSTHSVIAPTYETRNFSLSEPPGKFSSFNNDSYYGKFYTPFKATLNVNGSRVLTVNLEQGVRNDTGSSGVFGTGAAGEG